MRPALYCAVLVKLCRIGRRTGTRRESHPFVRLRRRASSEPPARPPYIDIEIAVSSPFHAPRRAPVQLLWDRPSRYRDDDVPLPELRQVHDRAMCAVPRPVRPVQVSGVRVHGAVGVRGMGKVAVSFRIMPEGVETDIDRLQGAVRKSLGGRLKKLEGEPVALGLRAIEGIAVLDDASGGMEKVESSLAALPGVGGVETTEVTLLLYSDSPRTNARARGSVRL